METFKSYESNYAESVAEAGASVMGTLRFGKEGRMCVDSIWLLNDDITRLREVLIIEIASRK